MRVLVPTHLRNYTQGQAEVDAQGQTLGALLDDLDAQFPGLKFRIVDEQNRVRPHVKCFIAGELAADLQVPVTGEMQIVAALSGG